MWSENNDLFLNILNFFFFLKNISEPQVVNSNIISVLVSHIFESFQACILQTGFCYAEVHYVLQQEDVWCLRNAGLGGVDGVTGDILGLLLSPWTTL